MLEHGAYTLLIDSCYDRERFPTRDEAIEWAWARTPEEIDAVDFVLTRFFELVDGRYMQKRISKELDSYQQISETNKRIAQEREENRRNRKRFEHEACSSVDEAPPNHKPLTINHNPIDTSHECDVDKTAVADSVPPCPHQEIIDLFHAECPFASQIREWTPARQQALRTRWREKKGRQNLDWWRKFFAYVATSDFLSGRTSSNGRKPFQLSLDWLLKSGNFVKVIEGRYENQQEVA